MKKTIYCLALTLLFFTSCDNGHENLDELKPNSYNTKPQKIAGDNDLDLLGYGCDATGNYLDYKYQVINAYAMRAAEPSLIVTHYPVGSYTNIVGGEDLKTMLLKFDRKFSVTFPIPETPFKGTVGGNYDIKNETTNKFSYARLSMISVVSHHEIRKDTEISTYRKYLDSHFKSAIETKTPQEIINLYGTHFYSDIITGGSFSMLYRARLQTDNKTYKVGYAANLASIDATKKESSSSFGIDDQSNIEYVSTSSIFQQSATYITKGGSGVTPIGTWKAGAISDLDFNRWSSTISKEIPRSLQLVEIGDNSLIPLYELVEDPTKKAALKLAIENHYNNNRLQVNKVVPLYGFKNRKTNNNCYSTNRNFQMAESTEWNYIGVAAYVFPTQVANSVPLYRFYKKVTKFMAPNYHNYYYTRDYQSGVINRYTYQGVECYVYANQIHGSTSLFQHRNDIKNDHEYTTNPSIISGYRLDGACAYVYHGEWNGDPEDKGF